MSACDAAVTGRNTVENDVMHAGFSGTSENPKNNPGCKQDRFLRHEASTQARFGMCCKFMFMFMFMFMLMWMLVLLSMLVLCKVYANVGKDGECFAHP